MADFGSLESGEAFVRQHATCDFGNLRPSFQVAIGKDVYVSLCRRHWEDEMGRGEPDDLLGFIGG